MKELLTVAGFGEIIGERRERGEGRNLIKSKFILCNMLVYYIYHLILIPML